VRIDRIEVDNALCFRHLRMQIDPEFQLIAGANNAGKSPLVRAFELFFSDPDGEQMLAMRPAHDYFAESGGRTLISVKLWFGDLSAEDREVCGAARRRDGRFWVAVRCSKAGRITLLTSQDLKGERARAVYEHVLDKYHFTKIPSIRIGGSGDLDRPASLERLMDTLESLLIRREGRRTGLQKQFSEEAGGVEKMVKEVLDNSATSIHAELPFQEGNVSFRVPDFSYALRGLLKAAEIESGADAVVPLAQRGTGFQSALILGVLRYVAKEELSSADSAFFAIEEPEAFLHPQTQRAMTQILKSIAEETQLLVTTHSPVVTDTIAIGRIARLPLEPEGTDFEWNPDELSDEEEGRLNRYCTAANSELIFANAVVLVEGYGDQGVIEHLLGKICTDAGGYFAQGITVIAANGIGNLKHLIALAERFGVDAHFLTDKDGLCHLDGSRRLLDALANSETPPRKKTREALISLADRHCGTYRDALRAQGAINKRLGRFGGFVLSSDLEGVLVDSLGSEWLLEALGPEGEGWLSEAACDQLADGADPRRALARRMGSKGWNCDLSTTGKLEPHLPRLLIADAEADGVELGQEFAGIEEWLEGIVEAAGRSSL
jgi:putative ATP-dependent endonuclease of the OLD family